MKDHPEFIALDKKCKAKKIGVKIEAGTASAAAISATAEDSEVAMHPELSDDMQKHLNELAKVATKDKPIMIKFEHLG